MKNKVTQTGNIILSMKINLPEEIISIRTLFIREPVKVGQGMLGRAEKEGNK